MTVSHRLPLRVRYRDTDCGGVVYHSNFVDYFEWGRTELLRSSGATYRAMEASGHQLVVIDLHVKYRSPARYDDQLEVETTLERVAGARIEFAYRVSRPDDDVLICTGQTTLACVDSSTGRPKRLPGDVVALFSGQI